MPRRKSTNAPPALIGIGATTNAGDRGVCTRGLEPGHFLRERSGSHPLGHSIRSPDKRSRGVFPSFVVMRCCCSRQCCKFASMCIQHHSAHHTPKAPPEQPTESQSAKRAAWLPGHTWNSPGPETQLPSALSVLSAGPRQLVQDPPIHVSPQTPTSMLTIHWGCVGYSTFREVAKVK